MKTSNVLLHRPRAFPFLVEQSSKIPVQTSGVIRSEILIEMHESFDDVVFLIDFAYGESLGRYFCLTSEEPSQCRHLFVGCEARYNYPERHIFTVRVLFIFSIGGWSDFVRDRSDGCGRVLCAHSSDSPGIRMVVITSLTVVCDMLESMLT